MWPSKRLATCPPGTHPRASAGVRVTGTQELDRVIGVTAVDSTGSKRGEVGEVYLDDETGRPEWATIHTGLFGTKESFVPLGGADVDGETLRVPYDKDTVKNAPQVDAGGHLSPGDESELYRYYGVTEGGTTTTG